MRYADRALKSRHHRKVQVAFEDHVREDARVSLRHADLRSRRRVEKLVQRRCQDRSGKGRHQADPYRAVDSIDDDALVRGFELLQHLDAFTIVGLARQRRLDIPAVALEQHDRKFGLELLDVLRDPGLRRPLTRGRGR